MFALDENDATPLYRQLYRQLRDQIVSGELSADVRLPSVRELVEELSVSRNTVEAAYQELYAEGYIYSRPRSGYFVSALDQEAAPRADRRAAHPCRRMPETEPEYRFDFHPARLDPESFPLERWRKCFMEVLRQRPEEMVLYGNPQGEWGLRRSIADYLGRCRAVVCDPEQVVICAGLQQGLDLVARLLREHRVVAVEDPGYFIPRRVFSDQGFEILPVPVGAGGLDIDRLQATDSGIVYVTPSHQLPLGCVMPVANRLRLIDWAQSGGRYIIEDDYDSELRYSGKPIPSLQGLRPDGNIIYAGTFSKVLSPALRTSYLVLPPSLLPRYRLMFRDFMPAVSLLEQRTLAEFMDKGYWERHIRRMRTIYKRKHDALLRAVERHFGPAGSLSGQGAGLHMVLRLELSAPGAGEIVERARQNGIRLFPVAEFYAAEPPESTTLLLGFGGMAAEEIERGVALLSRLCLRNTG